MRAGARGGPLSLVLAGALVLGPACAARADDCAQALRETERGAAYLARGYGVEAAASLERAVALAPACPRAEPRIEALVALSDLHLVVGDRQRAGELARDAALLSGRGLSPATRARLENHLGNVAAARPDPALALAHYARAVTLGGEAGDDGLVVRARLNAVRMHLALGAPGAADAPLQAALADARGAADLVAAAQLAFELSNRLDGASSAWRARAAAALQSAGRVAERDADEYWRSEAAGRLGALREREARLDEALALTDRAIFLAQAARSAQTLYRWFWQRGRILAARDDLAGATGAYRSAVASVSSRQASGAGLRLRAGRFETEIAPLHFQFADLLLRTSAAGTGGSEQAALVEARDAIERLRAAELEDHFGDDCVTSLRSRTAGVDRLDDATAVLYVIPLADRLELLLTLPSGLERVVVPVTGAALRAEVLAFRRRLERRIGRGYLRHAQQLHRWLVEPVEALLREASVRTLVFVPHGALRTVPMAALHDGERFLVERYAVATTPGLTLTDPRELGGEALSVLIAGVSEPNLGFPALPGVGPEIDGIRNALGGEVLVNAAFRTEALRAAVRRQPYSVVHIASHGQFDPDPEQTFLLAYGERIDMDTLAELVGISEFRSQPLELLTLSACQTAAGDERAALGLAGIAVKSGARSVLATLWSVDDVATTRVVVGFYEALRESGVSKAEALQRAQVALITDRRFRHPAYWSPFLLIGNWL